VVANLTTPAFDLSVPDWYLPHSAGGRLVIVPREATLDGVALSGWLARSGATLVQATPTTWQLLVDAGWSGSPELKIVCGGEPLSRALANALCARGRLWHMYGPTETTVWSSIVAVKPGSGPVSLGGPIQNTSFYVLDTTGQPVPVGVAGELHIGGDGLAVGYRERPELTSEKFIPNPVADDGATVYRTGDLVRWREPGTLEYLGRIDQQIKLRGHRIEPEEIQAVLESDPAVGAAAVIVREDTSGDRRLVAYVTDRDRDRVDTERLRRVCKQRLPPYMVPSSIVALERFPITPNGKLDRGKLPEPEGTRPALSQSYTAPLTPIELALAEIWTQVLGLDRVGTHDDFFDLGGHSLLAIKMLARVQDTLAVDIALNYVFDQPTIHQLAEAIGAKLLDDLSDEELTSLLADQG
jgi:acyl-CoA synthetase (AMP-forming)/AMP-acid ligase II